MKEKIIPYMCGFILIFLGAVVACGWLLRVPMMVQVSVGLYAMVFNTAISFILSGLLIILINFPFANTYTRIVQNVISAFLFIFAAAIFSQHIFDYQVGIDNIVNASWVQDPNLHPGRMAPNTAIGFMLIGLIGLSVPNAHKSWVGFTIQFNTFLLLFIACTGLIVYTLQLEYLFSNYPYTRMALPTALGFVITSVGIWTSWYKSQWVEKYYKGREDKKIVLMTGFLLVSLALIFAVGSMSLMAYFNIKIIHQAFSSLIQNKISVFHDEVIYAQSKTQSLASNYLQSDFSPKNRRELIAQINYFAYDFTGLKLVDSNQNTLFQQGKFRFPQIEIPLKSAPHTKLGWANGFFLDIEVPLKNYQGKILGYLITQSEMQRFNKAYANYEGLGQNGEIVICEKQSNKEAMCFPSRLMHHPFFVPFNINGKRVPMFYALLGQKGTMSGYDYRREQIIAAYSPIANYGLGMVIKVDASEIYTPIREQLYFLFPASFLLLSLGLLALKWQIVPLVKKVVESEHEMEKSKRALEVSEKRYEAAIRGSNTGLWDWDLKNDQVYYSLNYKYLLGYNDEEFTDKFGSFMERVHPEDQEKALNLLRNHFQNGAVYNVELRIRLKSNEYHWFQVIGKAVFDENDKPVRMSGTLVSINERKEIEMLKNEFISVVSHELRTPLTSIKGSIALLLGEKLEKLSNQVKRLLGIADKNCDRLISLINDILDIEKIEAGKLVLNLKPVHIASLINNAVILNQSFADKYHVSIKVYPYSGNPVVYADEDRLTQVLVNLLSNAIKYSPAQGTVNIHIDKVLKYIRVSIADAGPGIPDGFESKIFMKFSQANTKSTRELGGTGLGLSICKAIVEKHFGRINYFNNRTGGATFYFELPEYSDQVVKEVDEFNVS